MRSRAAVVAAAMLVPAAGLAQAPRIRSVAAGFETSCAVAEDGRAWCWGGATRAMFASGGPFGPPRPLAGAPNLISLSADFGTACGLASDSTAYCIGSNTSGLLGSGSPMSARNGRAFSRSRMAPVEGGRRFRSIALGAQTACGVAEQGRVWCWGANANGQFGNGAADDPAQFNEATGFGGNVPVAGPSVAFASVSVGHWHACALTAEGVAWCWGGNEFGQLGDGTTAPHVVPARVAGEHRFRSIVVANSGTCGVTLAGEGLCWGRNRDGGIGDGTQEDRHRPTAVAGGHRWRSIDAGSTYACGVAEDGAAWCWGTGTEGALGTGTIGEPWIAGRSVVRAFRPAAVVGGLRFHEISVGYDHTCGVTEDADVWCWGGNAAAQLGFPQSQFTQGTGTPQRVAIPDAPARAPRGRAQP